eukprot:6826587-Pyramimonas_sp.AAC.1
MGLPTYPEYPTAVLKACLTAPDNCTTNGVANLIHSDDVKKCSDTLKPQVIEAVQYWRYAKEWINGPLADSNLTRSDKLTLLGNLEVRCVMAIHNKKSRSKA